MGGSPSGHVTAVPGGGLELPALHAAAGSAAAAALELLLLRRLGSIRHGEAIRPDPVLPRPPLTPSVLLQAEDAVIQKDGGDKEDKVVAAANSAASGAVGNRGNRGNHGLLAGRGAQRPPGQTAGHPGRAGQRADGSGPGGVTRREGEEVGLIHAAVCKGQTGPKSDQNLNQRSQRGTRNVHMC